MLDRYTATLLKSSALPLEPWVLILIWMVLFAINHLIVKAARSWLRSQNFLIYEPNSVMGRDNTPEQIVWQVLYAALVFAVAIYAGNAVFYFLAGGMLVALGAMLGLNCHGLMFARTLNRQQLLRGQVVMSDDFAWASMAYRLHGSACFCLVLGLVLANLVLLGGALFLAATGVGYLRKARRIVASG